MFSSGLTRNFFRPSRWENCCSSAWPHSRDSRSRPRRRFFAQMQSSTNLARPRRSALRGSRRSRGRRGREVGRSKKTFYISVELRKHRAQSIVHRAKHNRVCQRLDYSRRTRGQRHEHTRGQDEKQDHRNNDVKIHFMFST